MTLGAPFSPILANLGENTAALQRESEKRLGHLYELAYAVAAEVDAAGDAASPFSFFPAASSFLASIADGIIRSAEDLVPLARFLCRAAEERLGRPLTLLDFSDGAVPPPERSRTVYVDSPPAEAAYRRFAPYLPAPSAVYGASFRELFDDVENGYAEYAILPLLADGVGVGSVARMIEEYGHSIVALTAIPSGDGEAVFALLSHRAVCIAPPTVAAFAASLDEMEEADLFAALPRLGLAASSISPLPPPPGRTRTLYGVTVSGEESAFVGLLSYLSLFLPGSLGRGFYFEID